LVNVQDSARYDLDASISAGVLMSAVKKKKRQLWKEISHEAYSDVISHCVHFSSRPVNTNARPVGVRLNNTATPMPYFAVCTVGPGKVDVDYLRNGGSEAAPFKQIRAVLEKRLGEFDGVNMADVNHIQKSCLAASKSAFEFDTHNIDPRLRQILWPTGNDEYLALTPLPSAGLSYLINSTVTVPYTHLTLPTRLHQYKPVHLLFCLQTNVHNYI